MADYTPEAIRATLHTLILGRKIELHQEVGSTNDLAKRAARKDVPEGLVVLAEEQLSGRGRLGRVWTAPPGSSILCSVLLRPRFSPDHAFYLTISAALAIRRAIDRFDQLRTSHSQFLRPAQDRLRIPSPRNCTIKWPNDVLINGRKVSGVLSESEFVGGEWAFAIVGFGINVSLTEPGLETLRATAPQATCLSAEWGIEVDRTQLLAQVLRELEGLYLAMQSGHFGPIYDEWAAALDTVGKLVSVNHGNEQVRGEALRVERDGSLVIKTASGVERRVLIGDVAG